jgi:hypothetical protein
MNTVSTLETSRISDCINYSGSIKGAVQKAINIELGARAVKHYERMGFIQFQPKKNPNRMGCTGYPPEEQERRARLVADRVNNGETVNNVCRELGFNHKSIRDWCDKYSITLKPTRTRTIREKK